LRCVPGHSQCTKAETGQDQDRQPFAAESQRPSPEPSQQPSTSPISVDRPLTNCRFRRCGALEPSRPSAGVDLNVTLSTQALTRFSKGFCRLRGLPLENRPQGYALWKPFADPCAFGAWINHKGFQRPSAFDRSGAKPWRVQGRSP
jgi:hypothetical protein